MRFFTTLLTSMFASIVAIAATAHANTMTYDIDMYLTGLDFDDGIVDEFQEGVGSATFELPALDGRALLVDFDMRILSTVFTEQDDLDFPDAPWAKIENGELVGISFSGINDVGAILTIHDTFAFSVYWTRSGHIVSGALDFRPVSDEFAAVANTPEPDAGLVFAIGLIVVAPWLRRGVRSTA